MRVAESRVAVLDSVTSTREHALHCVQALPVSPATIKKVGIAAGTAASVMGACVGLRKKKKAAEAAALKTGRSGYVWPLLVQLLGPVLLPMAQKALLKQMKSADNMGKSMNF